MLRTRRLSAAAAFALSLAFAGAWTVAAAPTATPNGAPADEASFDVEAYDVDGNSLLDQLSIEKSVYGFMGPGRKAADIEAARKALEDVYHVRGFDSVVVEIPAQTVADRVVRLHVVETTVGRLRVTGSRYYSLEDVKRQTPALAEGAVPNFRDAEAEITELNRLPARQVTPLVRPGKIPGTVDIDLKVADQAPVHASLELSNDHSADTTPLRLTATARYDNLWQLGHSATFSYAVAPKDRQQSEVFAGSYLAPLPNSHWSLLAYGYHSNSNVATIGDVSVLGRGWALGLRGIVQMPPIGQATQSLSVGLDYKHSFQYILPGQQPTTASRSAIDYVPLNAVYSLQWDTATFSTHASLGVTAGVRGTSGSDAVFQISRANARGNFVHLNFDLDHTHELPFGAEANLRLSTQTSNLPLVSGEQFSAGGLSSVRGYLQSAAVGDDGLFSSGELRSPLISVASPKIVDDFRIFGFSDVGKAWLINVLPDQQKTFLLNSAGLGARARLLDHVDSDLVFGVPLISARATDVDRFYTVFRLKAGF